MNDYNQYYHLNNNEKIIDKPLLILKEYGRNVQKLVNYVTTIEDKEKRTQYAYTLIDLMKQINPAMKEGPEYAQKLWDDLYIMSGFNLDVDSPYPMPEKEILGRKPKRLDYNHHNIRYKHYGRNMELLIDKAIALEDEEEKEAAVVYVGKLMKSFYASWNKDVVDDSVIVDNIKTLSKGRLEISVDKVKENNLFDTSSKDRNKRPQASPTPTNNQNKRRNNTPNKKRKN